MKLYCQTKKFFFAPNCPFYYVGAKLSWCQIVRVPNCPLLLSWCQIVRFYYLGAKLSALLSWCQIVRCQIVQCQIVRCQIVLQSSRFVLITTLSFWNRSWITAHCMLQSWNFNKQSSLNSTTEVKALKSNFNLVWFGREGKINVTPW